MADRKSNLRASDIPLRGISYPFRKESGEFPKTEINTEQVKNDLFLLFKTPVRTRVMRPTVGTDAHRLVFESQGPLLQARLERSIRQTIFLNEPRVSVQALEFIEEETSIFVNVIYIIQGVLDSVELEFDKQ